MSKRKNKLVPFETIVLATQGDPQALEQVIRHYRPYILSLCRREYIAENGNVSIVCDNELKLRLEAKLMAKILLFDIRERGHGAINVQLKNIDIAPATAEPTTQERITRIGSAEANGIAPSDINENPIT